MSRITLKFYIEVVSQQISEIYVNGLPVKNVCNFNSTNKIHINNYVDEYNEVKNQVQQNIWLTASSNFKCR